MPSNGNSESREATDLAARHTMTVSPSLSSASDLLDEDTARVFLERVRWPDGPECPHCGSLGAYRLRPKADSTRSVRRGVLKCKACRSQFTVTVGTAFENSHIPLSRWLDAIRPLCESREGLSAYRLHRLVGVSRPSAWFMFQRIREAYGATPRSPAGIAAACRSTTVIRGSRREGGQAGTPRSGSGRQPIAQPLRGAAGPCDMSSGVAGAPLLRRKGGGEGKPGRRANAGANAQLSLAGFRFQEVVATMLHVKPPAKVTPGQRRSGRGGRPRAETPERASGAVAVGSRWVCNLPIDTKDAKAYPRDHRPRGGRLHIPPASAIRSA
jgi:transposase-like protein